MKKIILSLLMFSVFFGCVAPSYAALTQEQKDAAKAKKEAIKAEKLAKKAERARIKGLKKTYKHVSKKMPFMEAMELMKDSPAIGAYEMIMGDNISEKPIKIVFKNLGEIKRKYSTFDAVNTKKFGTLYINVDERHKNAPPEALGALISSMPVHIGDKKDSVNEETYAWSVEAVVWSYFLQKNPDVKNQRSRLVAREEILREEYEKSPRFAKNIVDTVRRKRGDIRYKWESKGYTHKEYDAKIARLYDIYDKHVLMAKAAPKKEVVFVSNTKPQQNENDLKLAPKIDAENALNDEAGNINAVELKDDAEMARESYEHYVEYPVSASACKAPCSAQGSASCPGSCPSVCPNARKGTKDVMGDIATPNKDEKEITCPYCKANAKK